MNHYPKAVHLRPMHINKQNLFTLFFLLNNCDIKGAMFHKGFLCQYKPNF
jgi:hypothetical protein